MLVITALEITEDEAERNELECNAVDYSAIFAAEQNNSNSFDGCTQIPVYSIAFKPAEDMVLPIFLCRIHFGALKLSLHEGVGVDEEAFGEFPDH